MKYQMLYELKNGKLFRFVNDSESGSLDNDVYMVVQQGWTDCLIAKHNDDNQPTTLTFANKYSDVVEY